MKKLLLGLMVLPLMVSVPALYADSHTSAEPAATSAKADSALRADHPETYTVVKGDTLWDISGRFLSEPWRWKELWHLNPNIANPHLIYPGDTIKLVYIDGKAHLTVERGSGSAGMKDCTTAPTQKKMPDGTVKITPKCEATPLDEAIPPISLESIGPFLSENRVVETSQIVDDAPHIIAGERVAGGQGDVMFARGKFDPQMAVYDIYRTGKIYYDPDTQEQLGMAVQSLGQGKVVTPDQEVSRVELLRARQEVLAEDKLIPSEETKLASFFQPHAPEKAVSGKIIDVLGSVSQLGQYHVVLLNKGERDGLNNGTVLAAYSEPGVAVDPVNGEKVKLPAERAGLLMVFRTFEKLSYAIVLKSERPLALMDEVKNP